MSAMDRFGHDVGRKFVPVPEALLDHARDLGLDATDLAIIVALTRYRHEPGKIVAPAEQTLADAIGVSRNTVRARLRSGPLACYVRRIPGRRGPDGKHRPWEYDVDPLWAAVAARRVQSLNTVDAGDDGTGRAQPLNTDRVQNEPEPCAAAEHGPCAATEQEVENTSREQPEKDKRGVASTAIKEQTAHATPASENASLTDEWIWEEPFEDDADDAELEAAR